MEANDLELEALVSNKKKIMTYTVCLHRCMTYCNDVIIGVGRRLSNN